MSLHLFLLLWFVPMVPALEHIVQLRRHQAVRHANFTNIAHVSRYQSGTQDANSMLSTLPRGSGGDALLSTYGKDGLHSETLRNLFDLQYSAGFDLGTPSKRVQLIFDTGSSDLWVSHQAWTQRSSTWHNDRAQLGDKAEIFLQYGKGAVQGVLGVDVGCLPTPSAPLCVKQQAVIMAQVVEDLNLRQAGFDGILGLAFAGISQSSKATHTPLSNFLNNLEQQFDDLSFAFSLTNGPGSYVMFGERSEVMRRGAMETQSQVVATAPIETKDKVLGQGSGDELGWWAVKVGIEVSRNTFETVRGTVHAAADTGTSLMIMPPSDGHRVAAAMFGDHLSTDCSWQDALQSMGALSCKCDIVSDIRPLSLEIGGVRFRMAGHEMFLHTGQTMEDGREVCMTGLGVLPGTPLWILGDVFLRNVYAVHNFHDRTISFIPRQGFTAEETGLVAWMKAAPVSFCLVALVTMLVLFALTFSVACLAKAKARSRVVVGNTSVGEPLLGASL